MYVCARTLTRTRIYTHVYVYKQIKKIELKSIFDYCKQRT